MKIYVYERWIRSLVNGNTDPLQVPIGKSLPSVEKKTAIKTFEDHNRRVRETIPNKSLLEYSIDSGWQPLCIFLEIPHEKCPSGAFPRANSSTMLNVQQESSFLFASFGIIVIIYLLRTALLQSINLFKMFHNFFNISTQKSSHKSHTKKIC